MQASAFDFEGAWLVLVAGLALALLALGALARGAFEGWARRRKLRARGARAQRGEREAEGLLEGAGYRVLGRQVQGSYRLWAGSQERSIEVRVDYVVEAGGRRLVAEVKTGQKAVDIGNPATRRQLLEYRVAFEVEGVLLVDAEAGRVDEVRFPLPGALRARGGPGGLFWLLAGLVLGAGAAIALEGLYRAQRLPERLHRHHDRVSAPAGGARAAVARAAVGLGRRRGSGDGG